MEHPKPTLDKKALSREAVAKATYTRLSNDHNLTGAICPFDLATKIGIDVRFDPLKSLEGAYATHPAIVIGSQRPLPRQVFTCAHEIGHHEFEHGTRLDVYVEGQDTPYHEQPEEYLAQVFAANLLMPIIAIQRAFKLRDINPEEMTPQEAYKLSCYFGVGYTTFLKHLSCALGLLSYRRSEELQKIKLSAIRNSFGVSDPKKALVVLDKFWEDRPVDVEVGDLIICSNTVDFEGNALLKLGQQGALHCYEAIAQGRGRLHDETKGWAAYGRVRRKQFKGRAIYRHTEEVD